MRTVYALQFDITHSEPSSPRDQILEIKELLSIWIGDRLNKMGNIEYRLAFDGKLQEPLPNHHLVGVHQSSQDFDYLMVEWTYPGTDENSLLWTTTCIFCSDGQKIEVSVTVRISSALFLIKPLQNYSVRTPRIIRALLEKFDCRIMEVPIPTNHKSLSDFDQVESFVQCDLQDPSRPLPIVLLSKDVWTDQPFTDPVSLQYKLAGFAKVVVIEKNASFDLTGILGKEFSCYNGAIRLYWPGFKANSNPYHHPLFLQPRMSDFAAKGQLIGEHLFNLLSSIAATRFVEGALTQKVKAHFENTRTGEIILLRKQIEEKIFSIDEIEKVLIRTWDENTTLIKERDQALLRTIELEEEISRLKSNLSDIWEYQGNGFELPSITEPSLPEITSVSDALELAEQRFGCILSIWETAKDEAKKSQFSRPKEVFDAFEALYNISYKYFEKKSLGQSFEQAFEEYNLQYKPTEHQNTLTMYGHQRYFKNKGVQKQMLKHITIGSGSRNNCIQIYFEFDENEKKTLVGYCGFHLDYYSQRT